MKHYKVVEQSESDPSQFSSVMPYRYPWRLRYRIGEWTEPAVPGTKLFVFRSLPAARLFNYTCAYNGAVFECEVRGQPKQPKLMTDPLVAKMRRFWVRLASGLPPGDLGCPPPRATLWVDAVKLGQRLE
jgi:hypothetical protein